MKAKRKTKLYEWQEKSKKVDYCHMCDKKRERLTVDHIIPVSILDMLDITGDAKYNWEDNFQLICSPCNAFKANRIDITHPKTKGLLQELISKI